MRARPSIALALAAALPLAGCGERVCVEEDHRAADRVFSACVLADADHSTWKCQAVAERAACLRSEVR